MIERIEQLRSQAEQAIAAATSSEELEEVRVRVLGRKAELPQILRGVADLEPEQRAEMMAKTGRRTVPQIYIGEHHVGGYDDLAALERKGALDPLLAAG